MCCRRCLFLSNIRSVCVCVLVVCAHIVEPNKFVRYIHSRNCAVFLSVALFHFSPKNPPSLSLWVVCAMYSDRCPLNLLASFCFDLVPSVSSLFVDVHSKCTFASITCIVRLYFGSYRSLSFFLYLSHLLNHSALVCVFAWILFLSNFSPSVLNGIRCKCSAIIKISVEFSLRFVLNHHVSSIPTMFDVLLSDDGAGDDRVDGGGEQSVCCQYIIAHVIEIIIPSILVWERSMNCSAFLPAHMSIVLQWYRRIQTHKHMHIPHQYIPTNGICCFHTQPQLYTTLTVVRIEGENEFAHTHTHARNRMCRIFCADC